LKPADNARIYAVTFTLLAVLGVGFLCYRVLAPFLAAIAWAIVLAAAFQRPWRYVEGRLPGRRNLAAALLTVAVAGLVLAPIVLFVGVLAGQTIDLATALANRLSAEHVRSLSDFVALPAVASWLHDLRVWSGISEGDLQTLASNLVNRASSVAGGLSGKLAIGVLDALVTVLLVIFLLFFFFRDGQEMARATLELLPTDAERRQQMSRSLEKMLVAMFRGSLLCALAQGALGAIGWLIAGLPSPILAGVVTAAVSLLPVGGTALVWIPGAIWLWVDGREGSGIFLFAWGFLVTTLLVDAVLRPLLVRGAEELTTLIVFLGVFGGLAAFGLLGIFIGPVVLAIAATLIEALRGYADRSDASTPAPL
jgi:predicted PurR-regulated permease PerM